MEMSRNLHLSGVLTISLAAVLLMSACADHSGGRAASQLGRSARTVPSRTHPLKVQYVNTYGGDGSGPVHWSTTVMSDGQGRVRQVSSPGSYWWFIVSDGHRAVGSNQGDEPEETDPSQARVFLSPADVTTVCPQPAEKPATRDGTTTVLGLTGDIYTCADDQFQTEVVVERRTGLLLRVTGGIEGTVATKIDTDPQFSASTFAFPAVNHAGPPTGPESGQPTPDQDARENVRMSATDVELCAAENGGVYPRTLPCHNDNGPGLGVHYVLDGDTYTITFRSPTGHIFTYDRATGAITETS
jgi:hypothetical protein